jgi:hypothetical protein
LLMKFKSLSSYLEGCGIQKAVVDTGRPFLYPQFLER